MNVGQLLLTLVLMTSTNCIWSSRAALTCDWGQTHAHIFSPESHAGETNPIVGVQSSSLKLDAYYVAVMSAVELADYYLPRKVMTPIHVMLLARQSMGISSNWKLTPKPYCGLY